MTEDKQLQPEEVKVENTTSVAEVPMTEGPLKQIFIDYVGSKLQLKPETDVVTLEMLVSVLADEFPEFVLAIAENNYIRGYQQALNDSEFVKKDMEQKTSLDTFPEIKTLENE